MRISIESFADEMVKISVAKYLLDAAKSLKSLGTSHPKALGYGAAALGGGVAVHEGGKALEDLKRGRMIRRQIEEAQARG